MLRPHLESTHAIRAVRADSFGTYGARRVHAELKLGMGIAVGHNAVEMLMSRAGLHGLPGRKRRKSVHDTPTANAREMSGFGRPSAHPADGYAV